MRTEIVLTVSESKRLIAKGVAALDWVQARLRQGIVVVSTGSTNGYVYEELTGQTIDKRAYLTGRTLPAKGAPRWNMARIPDMVFVNGAPEPAMDRYNVLERMQPGDVFIKGANALNYREGIAGVTIGSPTGGTLGALMGPLYGKKLRLLIPVGLEKEVPYDILEASALLAEPDERLGAVHALWPVQGEIFTEIEAFHTLCGVEAAPVAAGGLAGAEGALRWLLIGEADDVRRAATLVESIQGEPPLQ
ncbi:MAG: hypothetical protein V1772_10780 [Chloroflexota bacterium]